MITAVELLSRPWFQLTLAGATLLGGASAIWYFGGEVRGWRRRKPQALSPPVSAQTQVAGPHSADVALFHKIMELMPFDPVGRFLQAHNFAASFEVAEWAGIHDYLGFAESPECRFEDSASETLRLKLTSALADFISASVGEVYTAHGDRMMGVPDEWDFKGHVNYGRFWPAVNTLNSKARFAYEAYELFVQKSRSVLLRR